LLVGAIEADSNGIAILLDEQAKVILRLRQGESHLGWTVESVKAREVTLRNNQRIAVLPLGGQ
jgi:general secretion pathway protein N